MFETKGSLILLGVALFSNLITNSSFAEDLSFVRVDYEVEMAPSKLTGGDFNGDGTEDLAVLGQTHLYSGGQLSLLLGGGDGTFGQPITFDCCGEPRSLATGDFNVDGILDVAIPFRSVYPNPDGVAILLGSGDGTFRRGPTFFADQFDPPHNNPQFVAVGDFNGDDFRTWPSPITAPRCGSCWELETTACSHQVKAFKL